MTPSNSVRDANRSTALAILWVATLHLGTPAAVGAETDLRVSAFHSVDVRNGAHVTLRHGDSRRVTVTRGNTTESAIRVEKDGRLLIDRCPEGCSRGYRLEVEVVTPEIDALSVTDGGWLRCSGRFPRQADLAVAVASGGTVDARSMSADDVSAAVQQGGRILTTPRESLSAAIAQGGAVIYWGNPDIQRSIQQGGVVSRGRSSDRDRPLEELGPALAD